MTLAARVVSAVLVSAIMLGIGPVPPFRHYVDAYGEIIASPETMAVSFPGRVSASNRSFANDAAAAPASVTTAAATVSSSGPSPTFTLERVSLSTSGVQEDGDSWDPELSDDGRYVAFVSNGSNLIDGETNPPWSWYSPAYGYLRDRQQKTTIRLPNGCGGISGNARYTLCNTWDQATGAHFDIHDLSTGADQQIWRNSGTAGGISADGRFIVFTAPVPSAGSSAMNVYLYDRADGSTTPIVFTPSGHVPQGQISIYAFSPNGRYVAFVYDGTDLDARVTSELAGYQLYVTDTTTHVTTLASVSSSGAPARSEWGYSGLAFFYGASVANDGSVVFVVDAVNFGPPPCSDWWCSSVYEIYRRTLSGTTDLISAKPDGLPTTGWAIKPRISPDGSTVVFVSWASDLVPNTVASYAKLFLRDLATGTTSFISVTTPADAIDGSNQDPAISADLRYIAFASDASTILPNTQNTSDYRYHIYVRTLMSSSSASDVDPLVGSSFGALPTVGSEIAEPVNTFSGNFSLSGVDLTISGRGPPLRLARSYNSRDPRSGIFGQGWSSDLGWSVQPKSTGDVLVLRPDGRRDLFHRNADGTFSAPSGVFDVLSARTGGGFTLTTVDQDTLIFGSDGLLSSYADLNGTAPSYVFTSDAKHIAEIDAVGGRALSFEYDADGHLVRASDSAARAVLYAYTDGRLTAVTDVTGAVTRYAYDASGHLTMVTDPLGNVTLQNAYDGGGRVTSQTDAVGGLVRFAYDTASRITTHTDARGNVTQIAHDASGRTVSVTDPLGKSVQYAYDDRGDRTSFTDRNGNSWRFTYDAQGNRTGVTDPAGGTAAFTYDAQNDLLSRTDPNGSTWRYAYDAQGDLTGVTDPEGGTTATEVDASGLPTKVTDADGVVTTYAYDPAGDLAAVTTAAGTVSNAYDAAGRLVSRTDADRNTSTFAYDALGRLLRTSDALGQATTFTYDAAGRPVSVTDRRGATTSFTYDASGRMTSSTDALGGVSTYAYDANGNRTALTDPAGKTTRFAYDARDRLTAVTDPLGATASTAYDDNGNVVATTDPLGHTASFAYDFRNLRTLATDRAGGRTTYAYDAAGRAVSSADPLGATTSLAYDRSGRLVTTTGALGGVTSVAYSAAGRRASLTDPKGNTTRFVYDASGRLVRSTDALGGTATLAYDPAGDVVSRSDALGRTTSFTYDALERLVASVDALGGQTMRAYDAEGAPTALTDANGATTAYAYDALGRLTAVTDALGGITRYAYGARGLLTSLSDANGHTRTYAYDADRRLVREADGLGRARTYSYDVNGDRTSMVDAMGRTTSYRYDAEDRLSAVGYADGTAVTYTRDAAGQRTAMTDPLGTTSYQYDALRRPTSVTDAFGKTVGYGYDANGLRTSLTYPDGRKAAYAYDALGRLTSVAFAGGTNVYSYDAVGNATSAAFANGTRFAATYDALDRITALTNSDGEGKTAASFSYAYDPLGNITGEAATGTHGPADQRTYAYDALSRLVAVTDREKQTTRYAYDAVGDRTAVSRNKGEDPLAASFDAAGELTTLSRGGSPLASFQYDASGELTSETTGDATTTFSWDAAGRLVGRSAKDGQTSYAYTGDGALVRETRSGDDPADAKTLQYTLDAAGPLSQVLSASEGKDATTFLYGLQRIAALGKDTRYYGTDVRGSVRTLTDERGKLKGTESYDAWGVPKDQGDGSAKLASLFGFTGERQDPKAGLEYLRARWYDPALGVFLSPDPAAGRLADPRTLSPYAYAMDDPTSQVDRSGLSASSLFNGSTSYAYAATAFYSDPTAQPTPGPQPFGQSAAYSVAQMFADLNSPDPGTQAAAFLKITAIGLGVGVGITVAATFALPEGTLAGAASSITMAGSAIATAGVGLFQRAQSWLSTAPGAMALRLPVPLERESIITNPVPATREFARIITPAQVQQILAGETVPLSARTGATQAFITTSEALPRAAQARHWVIWQVSILSKSAVSSASSCPT